MSRRLDSELEAVKAASPERGLDQLEPAVWRRIEAAREARSADWIVLPVRAAAVIVALGVGVAGGGFAASAAASDPQEISVFSIDSRLAPSTLLDEEG